jgi:hypothetical protein
MFLCVFEKDSLSHGLNLILHWIGAASPPAEAGLRGLDGQGVDFTKIRFGRKVFGYFFCSRLMDEIFSENADKKCC